MTGTSQKLSATKKKEAKNNSFANFRAKQAAFWQQDYVIKLITNFK